MPLMGADTVMASDMTLLVLLGDPLSQFPVVDHPVHAVIAAWVIGNW